MPFSKGAQVLFLEMMQCHAEVTVVKKGTTRLMLHCGPVLFCSSNIFPLHLRIPLLQVESRAESSVKELNAAMVVRWTLEPASQTEQMCLK